MDSFCNSVFWDAEVTWYTETPDFTPCFEKTVLTWIPCGFVWIFFPLDLYYSYYTKRACIPWTGLNGLKFCILLSLFLVDLALLYKVLTYQPLVTSDEYSYADIFHHTLKIITYSLVALILVCSKIRGVRSSGVQTIFWMLLAITETFRFRTTLLNHDDDQPKHEYICGIIYYPLILGQFLAHFWSDGAMDERTSNFNKALCPEDHSSFISRLFFHWFDGLAWKGFKSPLTHNDLWSLNERDTSQYLKETFDRYWTNELQKKKTSNRSQPTDESSSNGNRYVKLNSCETNTQLQLSVLPSLIKTIGPPFFFGALLKIIPDLLAFVSPQVLQLLIEFVESNEEQWKGIFYAILMLLSSFLQSLFTAQYSYRMYMTGLRLKSTLVSAIYRKALVISHSVRRDSSIGEIVNLMSVDVARMMECVPFLNLIWSAPFQVVLALYFLWRILGPASLAGLIVMILLVPINALIAVKTKKYQSQQMNLKDKRVNLMSEILCGIKVLKLYAWELAFENRIKSIRSSEVTILRKAAYLSATSNFLLTCSSFMVAATTLATFVLIDEENVLDAKTAFVSLALFNVMSTPLTYLALIILQLVQAHVSLKRINKFMNSEEIDPDAVTHNMHEKHPIVVKDGHFSWERETPTLKNINLVVPEGSLVAIIGNVGSGKSTLLSSLLGECYKDSGYVNTKGSIAYVTQQAWIQNASIKDNILFGLPYESSRYKNVVSACALLPDFDSLPARDATEIGEKGINLSGGQRQRIALARAAYSSSDIYFLDDPLSAVDSHVGKHIFDKLIGHHGLLRKRTRVLVTHNIAYLPHMNNIFVLKDGNILESGTYKELLDMKGAFAEFLSQQLTEDDINELKGTKVLNDIEGIVTNMAEIKSRRRRESSTGASDSEHFANESIGSRTSSFSKKEYEDHQRRRSYSTIEPPERLIEEEKVETKSVNMAVYLNYFSAGGWDFTVATLFLYLLYQGFSIGANFWLSKWSNESVTNEQAKLSSERHMYLTVYGVFGVLQAISILLGSLTMAYGALRASRRLHNKMLTSIIRAPMSFFDTTPIGRILNRFSRDVDTCDTWIPVCIKFYITAIFQVFAVLCIISINTPIFTAVIIPILIIYYFIQGFYICSSRQLKRMENVKRSPIYSFFGETVSGVPTIRAFRKQRRFMTLLEAKVDSNQMAYFPSVVSNRWLSIRLETIGNSVVFFAALFAILGRDTLNSGLVGLSVSYALQITSSLMMLVRWTSELETNIVCVERIKEYWHVEQEADWHTGPVKPPKTWPDKGVVEFRNYQTRYRPNLDLVLKNVTCHIQSSEKIGIVGRTGAGKSSLTLALFRIVEAANGAIYIDDIDISKLGLHDLRGRITVIPQDPVLFAGTLRMNLDPFELYSDDKIWSSLELAHLKMFLDSNTAGLEFDVAEGGENLSVGQRQLVCLARALLRKTKILVLDEATAAVDLETDNLIQETIRREFKDCTVITIAHRLNTILDSTRVIVLRDGEIKEFENPGTLLGRKTSIFFGMAKDAGITRER